MRSSRKLIIEHSIKGSAIIHEETRALEHCYLLLPMQFEKAIILQKCNALIVLFHLFSSQRVFYVSMC